MGLFFLNISINQMGDLTAFLQIVNCIAVCKQFTYTFETIGPYNVSYNGQVRLYLLLFVHLYSLHFFKYLIFKNRIIITFINNYKISLTAFLKHFMFNIECYCL